MKPKPLAVLKNFTVPVMRMLGPFPIRREEAGQKRAAHLARPRNSDVGKGQCPKAEAQPQIVRAHSNRSAPANEIWGVSCPSTRDAASYGLTWLPRDHAPRGAILPRNLGGS